MKCNLLLQQKEERKVARYNIPIVSRAQMQDLETRIVKNAVNKVSDEVDVQLREREYQAGTRAECIVFVAVMRAFGFGKKRIMRIWQEMELMLEELSVYKDDEVMDEMLFRALEEIGIDTKVLFKEYFEAEENFKKRRDRENKFLKEHEEYR